MPTTVPVPPDPKAFVVHHAEVRPGVELAYVRENPGGFPVLLVHGWPETKRIWWRNIAVLADAGFEVIVPDLRGFGDSGVPADGFHDLAAHARDLHALVHDVLGHARCAAVGSDLGGGVVQDLGLRFENFVTRQVIFNAILPVLPDQYAAAGLSVEVAAEVRQAADYYVRQSRDADALAAELDTPERRRRYVASFYGSRFWGTPGGFSRADVEFMTEPFADADRLRAGFGNYESAAGTIPLSEAAAVLRRERRAHPRPVRPGRPRDVSRLPGAVRGRVPRPGRSVRRSPGRPLPAVGAGETAERRRGGVLARPLVTGFYPPGMEEPNAPTPPAAAAPTAGAEVAQMSARVQQIVAAAETSAAALREETEQRARDRIAEADRAAANRVKAAEDEAQEILDAARARGARDHRRGPQHGPRGPRLRHRDQP